MTYRGTVRNGVVELEGGNGLPDGATVRVELIEDPPVGLVPADDGDLPALFTIGRRAIRGGPPDLATNLDHYLYGHPKVTDEQR